MYTKLFSIDKSLQYSPNHGSLAIFNTADAYLAESQVADSNCPSPWYISLGRDLVVTQQ